MRKLGIYALVGVIFFNDVIGAAAYAATVARGTAARGNTAAAAQTTQTQNKTAGGTPAVAARAASRAPAAVKPVAAVKATTGTPAKTTPKQNNASGGSTAAAPKPNAARAGQMQKVISASAPKVAASQGAFDVEDNPCKKEYWACMDMFCLSDNIDGGRCDCSNESIKLNKEYKAVIAATEGEIQKTEILSQTVEFGESANNPAFGAGSEISEACDTDDIACKVGAAKYNAAAALCETEVSEECKSGYSFAKLQYSQNVRNDCKAYQATIAGVKEKGAAALAEAQQNLREAAMAKLESDNKFDAGECRVELRSCMNTAEVCGTDWSRCVSGLDEKRFHCEQVLDNCKLVKESVWEGFVAEITPSLKSASLSVENELRQNCFKRISDCIVNACRDNITGQGETMDSCLARPEMAQSFCKVELDECDEKGQMWPFVKQKLAAMRVDKCTLEVKECLASDNACGKDYGKCLGLDLVSLYDMCPADKLVVCKQDKPDFGINDLGNMVAGIFLAIDNKQLADCQNRIAEKMTEVCGSTVNCNQFMSEKLGTQSLQYEDIGGTHVLTGVINWGSVIVDDGGKWSSCVAGSKGNCSRFPEGGTIDVEDYIETMKKSRSSYDEASAALAAGSDDAVAMEIRSVAGEIKRVIDTVATDQKISWCVNGRDLSQVTGRQETTEARFPLLLQGYKRIIAEAALAKATENHNVKVQKLIKEAEKNMNEKALEFACYKKPMMIAGRFVPEPGKAGKNKVEAESPSVQIIGRSIDDSEIAALTGEHTVQMDEMLTKTVKAAYKRDDKLCHICVDDVFRGKRKYVDPRANKVEELKQSIKEAEEARKAHSMEAYKASGGLAGMAVGGLLLGNYIATSALFFAMPIGPIIFAAVATAAIITVLAGVFSKADDPGEHIITRAVDYCYDEEMGLPAAAAAPAETETSEDKK